MEQIRAKNEAVRRILEAAANGDLEHLKSVRDNDLRNSVCNSGCSALHWAAGKNQVQVLRYLISEGKIPVDIPAVKKSKGRTALHYSCRNGCLEATRYLVEEAKAQANPLAKHGVSPFQLAVWQNQLETCQYLVEDLGVDPKQVNAFNCGAIHWMGICPTSRANVDESNESSNDEEKDGSDLLPLAKWLAKQPGLDFKAKQRQGHSALHKAAWGGHLLLIKYLRNEHGLWDDSADDAGNYAADLADMANTSRHSRIAQYLREECSTLRAQSCAVLGVDPKTATRQDIRKAYLDHARLAHPDKNQQDEDTPNFDAVRKAYIHLIEEDGRGNQSNPAHSLNLMLQVSGLQEKNDEKNIKANASSCFKARLIAVLLEYGDKGLDVSNVKKKWKQVWPKEEFPDTTDRVKNRKVPLSDFLKKEAGDVIELVYDNSGVRVLPKFCSQDMVAAQAAKTPKAPKKE